MLDRHSDWRFTASRTNDVNRTFAVRDDEGELVGLVNFRQVCALSAVDKGMARAVRRRRSWYGMYDEWLEPHTDLFGVGSFTLQDMQRDGLVSYGAEDGEPLVLTDKGRAVCAAIREAGVSLLMTEAVA